VPKLTQSRRYPSHQSIHIPFSLSRKHHVKSSVLCLFLCLGFSMPVDALRPAIYGEIIWLNREVCHVGLKVDGKPMQIYLRHTGYKRKGFREGLWKSWRSRIKTTSRKCLVKQHRKKAHIFVQTSYLRGRKHGRWLRVYSHGYKVTGGHRQGLQSGRWKYYTDKGQIYQLKDYKKGQYHGKVIDWWVLPSSKKKGQKGSQKIGGKKSEAYYKNGRLHGMSFSWNRDGTLYSQTWSKGFVRKSIFFHPNNKQVNCSLDLKNYAVRNRNRRIKAHCKKTRTPYTRKALLKLFSRYAKKLN